MSQTKTGLVMWRISVAVLLMLAIIHFTTANVYKRVVGGTLVQPGDYPFLVSLWYMNEHPFTKNTKMHHMCGGTLIDPDWVLTAAHCFMKIFYPGMEKKEAWKVVVGKHNQLIEEDTNQVRDIEEINIYKNWKFSTITGDAALLKLNQSVDLSAKGVATIKTDQCKRCAVPGADCYVVGWGQVAENPYGYGMYVPVMGKLAIIDSETCKRAMNPENDYDIPMTIDDTTLCAGDPKGEVDSCAGDSGGPLVCKCNGQQVVSGIVSSGRGCARKGVYGKYTSVYKLRRWIKQVMK